MQQADFGLILGSGLGELANEITDAIAIPFSEIPHFLFQQSLDMLDN